ncbi:MAG: GreA/GreB family elongation factor [Patescibacteria group bacterium]
MRLPNRQPGKYTFQTYDKNLTQEKFDELQSKLERIIKITRPQAIKDVKLYAQNGDFSENAEYQIAKSRLRGLNRAIDEIREQLKDVHIIQPSKNTNTVQLGHKVKISSNNKEFTFQILGSSETNPSTGIISYSSPIGSALMGKKVGDIVQIKIQDKTIEYTILNIE